MELLGYEAVHDGFDVARASRDKTMVALRRDAFLRGESAVVLGCCQILRGEIEIPLDFSSVFSSCDSCDAFALLTGQGLSSSVFPGSLQHMAVHASACSVAQPHHVISLYRRYPILLVVYSI